MSKIDTLRKRHCLPASSKSSAVLNHAIRSDVPGAGSVLTALEALNYALQSQKKTDQNLQAIFDQLRQVRNAMCDYVLRDTVDTPRSPKKSETVPSQQAPVKLPTQPIDTPLGTMPDTEAAKLLGVSHFTARKRRIALGIPAFAGAKRRVEWSRWDAQLLNNDMTVDGLAQLIGCDPSTVRERRRFLRSKKGKYAHDE